MAIVSPAPQVDPIWAEILGPIGQAVGQNLAQKRSQRQNVEEGTMLNSLLQEAVQKKGENLNALDMIQILLSGQEKGISPKTIQSYMPAFQKAQESQMASQQQRAKTQEKEAPAMAALENLARMREIQKTGHLGGKVNVFGTGRKIGSTFSKEGQRLRSEYERLGKSLIQASTNIPIRNRQEFETLAEDLYDTTKSNEEILGTLDAMERIIKQSLGGGAVQTDKSLPPEAGKTSERQQSESVMIKDARSGRSVRVPKEEWDRLTEQEREGYEIVG